MSLGRAYTVTADAVSETTAQDLVRVTAPATAIVVIDKVTVTQESQTSSEALAVQLQRSSTAGTGAAIVPEEMELGGGVFGGTALGTITADTTIDGLPLVREGWNVLAPFVWHPTPEERIVISPSGIFVVRLDVAPGAAMLLSTVVSFREIGT